MKIYDHKKYDQQYTRDQLMYTVSKNKKKREEATTLWFKEQVARGIDEAITSLFY